MRRVWSVAQALSLDVAVAGWACGVLAAFHFKVSMPLAWHAVLPLCIWAAYTTDHVLDGFRLRGRARTLRHRLHIQYAAPLGTGAVLAGSLALYLAWKGFSPALWRLGWMIGALCLAHFSLVALAVGKNSKWLTKEAGVGLIFTLGVWGGPWLETGSPATLAALLPAFQFLCLTLINLLTFSMFEYRTDARTGQTSMAIGWGLAATRVWIACLAAGVIVGGCLAPAFPLQLVFCLMLGLLLWIGMDPKRFAANEGYRLAGDGAFLLPVLIWLF